MITPEIQKLFKQGQEQPIMVEDEETKRKNRLKKVLGYGIPIAGIGALGAIGGYKYFNDPRFKTWADTKYTGAKNYVTGKYNELFNKPKPFVPIMDPNDPNYLKEFQKASNIMDKAETGLQRAKTMPFGNPNIKHPEIHKLPAPGQSLPSRWKSYTDNPIVDWGGRSLNRMAGISGRREDEAVRIAQESRDKILERFKKYPKPNRDMGIKIPEGVKVPNVARAAVSGVKLNTPADVKGLIGSTNMYTVVKAMGANTNLIDDVRGYLAKYVDNGEPINIKYKDLNGNMANKAITLTTPKQKAAVYKIIGELLTGHGNDMKLDYIDNDIISIVQELKSSIKDQYKVDLETLGTNMTKTSADPVGEVLMQSPGRVIGKGLGYLIPGVDLLGGIDELTANEAGEASPPSEREKRRLGFKNVRWNTPDNTLAYNFARRKRGIAEESIGQGAPPGVAYGALDAEHLGPALSALLSTGIGEEVGRHIGKSKGNQLKGALIGGGAGFSVAAVANLLAAIHAGIMPRRTTEEQTKVDSSRLRNATKWMVPGFATYDDLKRLGKSRDWGQSKDNMVNMIGS